MFCQEMWFSMWLRTKQALVGAKIYKNIFELVGRDIGDAVEI
jgi:hypothetical protein